MNMTNGIGLLVALFTLLSSAAAVLFGTISFLRVKRADGLADGQHSGAVLTELGYIKSGIDDIKQRQDRQESRVSDLLERVAAVESVVSVRT